MTSNTLTRFAGSALLMISFASVLTTGSIVVAAENAQSTVTAEEDRIVQRLKQEIMEELKNGEFLQQQIEIGIRNFILKQQQAQAVEERQQRGRADKLAENVRRVSTDRDHIVGNPDAEVSLIEYSDFECPFCKRFHVTAGKLVEAFAGKVNWVYRHYPLDFHNPGAQKQAEASECADELAGNEMFWKYTDAVYDRTQSGGRGFPVEDLVPLAVELGMDKEEFANCLDSGRTAARVREDLVEGSSVGVTGTPGNILLNNNTGKTLLRPGAQPFDTLKADIERLMVDE